MPPRLQPVVLCGGSGTRMWPLSRRLRPKQLLPLTGEHSLLQDTVRRLDGLGAEAPVVVCGDAVRFAIREQLAELGHGDARFLVEPTGRNTAPAVTLAALALADDPLLLVMPSDHHVDDPEAFRRAVAQGLPAAEAGALVVFGVVPHAPETGYGWIHRGPEASPGVHAVQAFTEKPDAATAEAWLAGGAHLWNSGIFLFRASVWRDEVARHAPEVLAQCEAALAEVNGDHGFERVGAAFGEGPSISVDYAVMERTERAVVVPLDAGWSDVGSWSALWEVSQHDDAGNAYVGDAVLLDCEGSYVRAGHRLVVGVGLRDQIVIETADAVLVIPKDRVQQVREVVDTLHDAGRPEVEVHTVVEKPWGAYSVLEVSERFQVKCLVVKPGEALSLQRHAQRDEQWVVAKGAAEVTVGSRRVALAEGQSVHVPRGVTHRLANPGEVPLTVVEVQIGQVDEADIERLDDRYGRDGDMP